MRWHYFLERWNGLSLMRLAKEAIPTNLCIQTDASGSWGCGAAWGSQWFQWQWPDNWKETNIMAKELTAIAISCVVWGPELAKQRILVQCDNMSVVLSIRKGNAKGAVVMHLLRTLSFFIAFFNIDLTIEHIAGVKNCAADMLSRNSLSDFFLLCPQVSRIPTLVPLQLFPLLTP